MQSKKIGELGGSGLEECIDRFRERVEELRRKLEVLFRAGGETTVRTLRERVEEYDVLQREVRVILSLLSSLSILEKAFEGAEIARNRVVNSPAYKSLLPAT